MTISSGAEDEAQRRAEQHRFMPIWSSKALATNKVIAKLRNAAPSAAADQLARLQRGDRIDPFGLEPAGDRAADRRGSLRR